MRKDQNTFPHSSHLLLPLLRPPSASPPSNSQPHLLLLPPLLQSTLPTGNSSSGDPTTSNSPSRIFSSGHTPSSISTTDVPPPAPLASPPATENRHCPELVADTGYTRQATEAEGEAGRVPDPVAAMMESSAWRSNRSMVSPSDRWPSSWVSWNIRWPEVKPRELEEARRWWRCRRVYGRRRRYGRGSCQWWGHRRRSCRWRELTGGRVAGGVDVVGSWTMEKPAAAVAVKEEEEEDRKNEGGYFGLFS